MIYTLLSWIYITVLAYPAGLAFHKCLQRFCNDKDDPAQPHFTITCISGLLVISFICSFICLFYPLNVFSNILLLVLSGLLAFMFRKELTRSFRTDILRLRAAKSVTCLLFFLYLIIICYLSY